MIDFFTTTLVTFFRFNTFDPALASRQPYGKGSLLVVAMIASNYRRTSAIITNDKGEHSRQRRLHGPLPQQDSRDANRFAMV
ncbi:MAG: hypothetical protein CMP96_07315 [Gammaproteobacteria bacterium]|nr:hypothetical protein [Gammaproteobacteria bacterium]